MLVVKRQSFPKIVERLSKAGEIGVDTETTGLKERDRLFSVIIADAEESFYFNFKSYPGLDEELVLPRSWLIQLQSIFSETTNVVYICNAKFDLGMLAKEGITFDCRVVCTQTQERLLRNNLVGGLKAYSLASQAARIGEKKDGSVEEFITRNRLYTKTQVPGKKKIIKDKHFDQVPFEVITPYGGRDAELHRILGVRLGLELDGLPDLSNVRENEERLTKTCFRMERRGILLDRAYTESALQHETNLLERSRRAFHDLTGEAYEDKKSLLIRVFSNAGEKIPKTAKGNDSLKDEHLEAMTSPAARAVQRIRHHEKRIGTYYSSFLFSADDESVIRANINQAGTETGRFSYSEPNLQNVPKEDEEEDLKAKFLIRSCFIPRPGFCFVMIDYSQQEYRMMFDYAGQMDMIKAIMNGADAHQATGDLMGITRKKAKNVNFAYLYGAGIEQLARTAGTSIAEARELKKTYSWKFPYVDRFVKAVIQKGRERGHVRNWMGRRNHISSPEFAYILPNHLIQGGCADVVKRAMNMIDDFLLPYQSKMVVQVHDEIVFEIHQTELHLVPRLKDMMESVYPSRNGMKLEASVEHSWKSWGARDKVKGMPCEPDSGDIRNSG